MSLRPLVEKWMQLRNEKNWEAADALRSSIESVGVKLSVKAGEPEIVATKDFDPSKLGGLK